MRDAARNPTASEASGPYQAPSAEAPTASEASGPYRTSASECGLYRGERSQPRLLPTNAEHVVVGADEDLAVRDRRRRDGALAEIVARDDLGRRPAFRTIVSPFSLTK